LIIFFAESYSNFLLSSEFGAPISKNYDESSNSSDKTSTENLSYNVKCWLHLSKLYFSSIDRFNTENIEAKIDFKLPIILCAFSKGCIVLNQICNEAIYLTRYLNECSSYDERSYHEKLSAFSNCVRQIIWLDGGHCGTSNAWITNDQVIDMINRMKWHCYVYVTPYQIKSRKQWAVEEYKIFLQLLAKSNVKFKNTYYFESNEDDYDIETHFEVLSHFDTQLL
jgi:hypothetical protein